MRVFDFCINLYVDFYALRLGKARENFQHLEIKAKPAIRIQPQAEVAEGLLLVACLNALILVKDPEINETHADISEAVRNLTQSSP